MSSSLRLALLADVHGNLPALEAVLADAFRGGPVNAILVAGDIIMGAPYPTQVLDRLESLGAIMILGNRDRWLLRVDHGNPPEGWHRGQHCGVGRWTHRQLSVEQRQRLWPLPDKRVVTVGDAAPILMVHGSPQSVTGVLIPDDDPVVRAQYQTNKMTPQHFHRFSVAVALAGVQEAVMVCGHTHLQWQQRAHDRLAVNPGGAGEPLQGDPDARYALLHWDGSDWTAELRRVPYDKGDLAGAYAASGLLEEGGGFARASLRNIETGLNFTGHYRMRVGDLAQAAGLDPHGVVPDALWEEAERHYDWELGPLVAQRD